MSEDKSEFNYIIDVNLRPKRQITLPQKICEKFGLEYGDKLELRIKDNYIIVKPKKTLALNALSEIRNAFQRSGINEEELLKSQEIIRHERQKKTKDFS
jgi:AbrB family looped-hinge helix DNA binding protein